MALGMRLSLYLVFRGCLSLLCESALLKVSPCVLLTCSPTPLPNLAQKVPVGLDDPDHSFTEPEHGRQAGWFVFQWLELRYI